MTISMETYQQGMLGLWVAGVGVAALTVYRAPADSHPIIFGPLVGAFVGAIGYGMFAVARRWPP